MPSMLLRFMFSFATVEIYHSVATVSGDIALIPSQWDERMAHAV